MSQEDTFTGAYKGTYTDKYKKLKTFGDITVYENPFVLPLGFAYNSYITEKEFKSLQTLEKEEIMMYAAVTKHPKDINKYKIEQQDPFPINLKSLTINNGEINKVSLNKNFEFTSSLGDPQLVIPLPKREDGWKIEFEIQAQGNTSGQRFDPGDSAGTYIIKNFKIVERDLKKHQDIINDLSKNEVTIEKFTNSYIKGNINADKKQMLFFSIPYDKGWVLKVDGKKVDTERVNFGFIGAMVSKGSHTVELQYKQPLYNLGIALSILCWGIIIWKARISKKIRNKKMA